MQILISWVNCSDTPLMATLTLSYFLPSLSSIPHQALSPICQAICSDSTIYLVYAPGLLKWMC